EGHTAHATKQEAIEETERMLEVYRRIMTEELALPVVPGVKSDGERFPGAEETYTTETMMSDTKALQAGTSHFLGQNFSKAFNIQFQNKEEQMEFAWTTSWGVSTRLIGAVIMTHSDDDGLILPPRIAPKKVAILPISKDEARAEQVLLPKAKALGDLIESVIGLHHVDVDRQFHMRPGDRFFYHLQKGVPLRLELGEKEFENGVVRAVRRDTGEKLDLPWEGLEIAVSELLETIQKDMFEKARSFREQNTYTASSLDELKDIVETKGGFVKAYFGGTKEDEKAIKESTGATVRCFPLEDQGKTGRCFYTGKEGSRLAILAKSY
ncbi:MAG: His/Gly/Thr/Pro-type tRNA ligase C-terminal domain-containing protein, partial [Dethiosulfovibrio sp.]|nr:His/Gly/Thr/Pro-type tRNA ligase C-terminal domain-containing protein [Dethiosulfovibrio sp.]